MFVVEAFAHDGLVFPLFFISKYVAFYFFLVCSAVRRLLQNSGFIAGRSCIGTSVLVLLKCNWHTVLVSGVQHTDPTVRTLHSAH